MITLAVRRLATLAFAASLALGLAATPGVVQEVRAAAPDLTIVSDARYDVQPDDRRVRVTLTLVLTNHLKDTVTRRYYFDEAFLAVLPNTTGHTLTWEGNGSPTVRVSKETADYTLLRLHLGQRLFSGKSATYTLRFDLPDPGGAPTRDVRVGTTLASFPVWAFATDETPGSTVKVVFPPGFEVDVEVGELPDPITLADGRLLFQTGELAEPLDFFAYVVADRPGAYAERAASVTVNGRLADLRIRSWPDDPAWSDRVGGLFVRALPVIGEEVGLPWPDDEELVVQEAASRSTGGYAGLFDPAQDLVEVAYYASEQVVLHEAAHAWFNGSLLADRWANEAFASYYGLLAADRLGLEAEPEPLTPELEAAAIPLNAWGPLGRDSGLTEDYAYAASLAFARAVAERAGDEALRAVWADAAAGLGAYQPPASDGAPELVEGRPDWRGLLDLVEAKAGDSFDDLWRRWVVRDSDRPLLDARREARARYEDVLAAAGDWRLPTIVREALRAWQFDEATRLLDGADVILGQRAAIQAAAAAAGLTPPDTLRDAFELPDGFAVASVEAAAELDAIARYEAAVAHRPAEPDALQTLGMWGTTPELDIERARELFAAGDLSAANDASEAAAIVWASATDVGRGRVVSIATLLVAVLLAIGLLVGWERARRRRRRRFAARWVGADSYATLAATLDPPPSSVAADEGRMGADRD